MNKTPPGLPGVLLLSSDRHFTDDPNNQETKMFQSDVLALLLERREGSRAAEVSDKRKENQERYEFEHKHLKQYLGEKGVIDPQIESDPKDGRAFVPLALGWRIRWKQDSNNLELYNEVTGGRSDWIRNEYEAVIDEIAAHNGDKDAKFLLELSDVNIHEMDIWESARVGRRDQIGVTRVPGGWIMRIAQTSTFVPYSDEFKPSDPGDDNVHP